MAAAMRCARGTARGFTMLPDLSVASVGWRTRGFITGLAGPDRDRGFMVLMPCRDSVGCKTARCSGEVADKELLPPAYDRPKLICMAVEPSALVAMRFTMRRSVNWLQ